MPRYQLLGGSGFVCFWLLVTETLRGGLRSIDMSCVALQEPTLFKVIGGIPAGQSFSRGKVETAGRRVAALVGGQPSGGDPGVFALSSVTGGFRLDGPS